MWSIIATFGSLAAAACSAWIAWLNYSRFYSADVVLAPRSDTLEIRWCRTENQSSLPSAPSGSKGWLFVSLGPGRAANCEAEIEIESALPAGGFQRIQWETENPQVHVGDGVIESINIYDGRTPPNRVPLRSTYVDRPTLSFGRPNEEQSVPFGEGWLAQVAVNYFLRRVWRDDKGIPAEQAAKLVDPVLTVTPRWESGGRRRQGRSSRYKLAFEEVIYSLGGTRVAGAGEDIARSIPSIGFDGITFDEVLLRGRFVPISPDAQRSAPLRVGWAAARLGSR